MAFQKIQGLAPHLPDVCRWIGITLEQEIQVAQRLVQSAHVHEPVRPIDSNTYIVGIETYRPLEVFSGKIPSLAPHRNPPHAVLSIGIVLIKSVDGLGPKGAKINTYKFLVKTMPKSVHAGFKLFFDEDQMKGGILMTPKEVMALLPEPEYVMYE